jgi:hypothetical protein
MHLRVFAVAVALFLTFAACSSTSTDTPAPDVVDSGSSPVTCGSETDAASKPRCQRGGPCNCDDVGRVAPICTSGTWTCPSGTTRYEDCHGVPPIPNCVDDAGSADGG